MQLSALLQLYPREPTGNLARHLKTLAALVCGIIGSKKTHLPAIASKAPDGNKRESRTKRFARFLQNKNVTPEDFFGRLLCALRPGSDGKPAAGAAGAGHGRQPGGARVHGSDGERPLPKASTAPMLAGGSSQERPLSPGATSATAGTGQSAGSIRARGRLSGRRRV